MLLPWWWCNCFLFSCFVEWSQLAKLRLQRLHPSVWCDDESMTLHIHGSQVPNFLVDTGVCLCDLAYRHRAFASKYFAGNTPGKLTGILQVSIYLPQTSAQ